MIGFHNLDIGVGHSNKDGLMLWSLLDFGEDNPLLSGKESRLIKCLD